MPDIKIFRLFTVLFALLLTSGCATLVASDNRDPVEGLNRAIFKFNEGIDNVIFKPVAKGYRAVVPAPIDKGVTNFFGNINDVVTMVNNMLQFKFRDGGSDIARVVINSTVGILGLIDVASDIGFQKHNEDFGQTLGKWGVGNGPYLMLPIVGPSTLRDTVGIAVDNNVFDPLYKVNHIPTRNSLLLTEAIDKRADLLGASNVMEQAALDRYDFLKESYFQKREFDVNDGELAFPE